MLKLSVGEVRDLARFQVEMAKAALGTGTVEEGRKYLRRALELIDAVDGRAEGVPADVERNELSQESHGLRP